MGPLSNNTMHLGHGTQVLRHASVSKQLNDVTDISKAFNELQQLRQLKHQ
jgi:hypothetical protein